MIKLKIKSKYLILVIFVLLSYGYFSGISGLGINQFWKGELALIPIQVMALIYTSYSRQERR